MAAEPDDVLPSVLDPEVECVRIGSRAHLGDHLGAAAAPPPGAEPEVDSGLCPPGYVPRRRRRRYDSAEGKRVVTGEPPTRNPRPEN
jgi:hypothetical protein